MADRFLMYPGEDDPRGPYSLTDIALWQSQSALPAGTLVSRGDAWVPVDEELAAPGLAPATLTTRGAGTNTAMPARIEPGRPVLVRVPPAPPQQRYLGRLRDEEKRGVLPESIQIQIAPGTAWISIADARQRYPELAPTRSTALVAALVAIPSVFLFVQLSFVGFTGMYATVLAWLVMGVAALVINRSDALRSRTPLELLREQKVASAVIGGLGVLLITAGLVQGVHERARDKRVAALLADADPCAVQRMTPADKASLGWGESTTYKEKSGSCTGKRDADKRNAACAALVAVLDGKQPPSDAVFNGLEPDERALARRIAKRELTSADLAVSFEDLPCSRPAVVTAFVGAAAKSDKAWKDDSRISADLRKGYIESGAPPAALAVFSAKAEAEAKNALDGAASTDDLAAAKDKCAMVKQMKGTPPAACADVDRLEKRLAEKERVEGAVAAAKQAQEDRVTRAKQDRFDRCDDACEKRYPGEHNDLCMKKCCSGGAGCPKE